VREQGFFRLPAHIGNGQVFTQTSQTGQGDFVKMQIGLHHLCNSHRDDQNAYVERPIWISDERVMISRRLDPDLDRSDRLARAVKQV